VGSKTTRTSRALNGLLTSLLQYCLQIGFQVVLFPLVLRYAGSEAVGTFSILMQAISYLSLVDLGFNVALGRYLAQSWNAKDGEFSFDQVFATGTRFHLVTYTVVAVSIAVVGLKSEALFGLSAALASQAETAFFIMAGAALLKANSAIYVPALAATQNLAASNLIGLSVQAIRAVISLVLVARGWGLVGLALGYAIADLFNVFAHRIFFERHFRRISRRWAHSGGTRLLRAMTKFGFTYFFSSLGGKLFLSTDLLIVGRLFGAVSAAKYYTTQIPAFLLMTLVWRITENATPAINDLYGSKRWDALRQAYLDLLRVNLVATSGLALGIIFFTRAVVGVWMGSAQYAGDRMSVALGIFVISQTLTYQNAAFFVAAGRVKLFAMLSFCAGIINVALSVVLGRRMGIEGVMIASVIIDVPLSIILWVHVSREIGIERNRLFFETLVPALAVSAPLALLSWLFLVGAGSHSFATTVLYAALFLIVWGSMTIAIGLPKHLRTQILDRLSPRAAVR
jgi:O-antigen/teichoic acid export membrane protein